MQQIANIEKYDFYAIVHHTKRIFETSTNKTERYVILLKIIQIEAIFLHFHSSFISTLFVVKSGVVGEDKEGKKRSEFVSLMH